MLLLGSITGLCSCKKDNNPAPSFSWEEHYLVGTTTAVSTERASPYILALDDDGTGILTTTTSSFPGTYKETGDSLIFHTNDREKWLSYGFKNQQLGESHYEVRFYEDDGTYEPAPVKYDATGVLGEVPAGNALAGKTFVGDQYRFGTEGVYAEGYTYAFSAEEQTYGSGTEAIDDGAQAYELFRNVAFRHAEGNTKEFGTLINGELVVFRESGLFYWGKFK